MKRIAPVHPDRKQKRGFKFDPDQKLVILATMWLSFIILI